MDIKSAENMDFNLALDWMKEEYKKTIGEEKCYLHDSIVFMLRYKKMLEEQSQIVRCKDCKFTQEPIIEDYVGKRIWCNKLDRYFDNDWFCADGERKE